jgi:co-chaperonin GroES (HSP10)
MAIGLKSNIQRIHCNKLRAIGDKVIVHGMYFGSRKLQSGIVLMDDDKKSEGIKPRWAQVYSIGPDAKVGFTEGQYVLVAHGRWSRGINITDAEGDKTIRTVDPNDCLMVSDEPQDDMVFGDKTGA